LAVSVPAFCGEIRDPAQNGGSFPLEGHPHGYLRAYEGPPLARAAVALVGVRAWGQDGAIETLQDDIPNLTKGFAGTPRFSGAMYLMKLDGRPLYAGDTPREQDGTPRLGKLNERWLNVELVELLPGPHDLDVVLVELLQPSSPLSLRKQVPGILRVHFDAVAGHSYLMIYAVTGLYNPKATPPTKTEVGQHEGDPASVMYEGRIRLSLSVVEAPASAEEACRNHTGFTGFGGGGRRMCEFGIRAVLKSLDKGFASSRKP
jgi:hypothetical protein